MRGQIIKRNTGKFRHLSIFILGISILISSGAAAEETSKVKSEPERRIDIVDKVKERGILRIIGKKKVKIITIDQIIQPDGISKTLEEALKNVGSVREFKRGSQGRELRNHRAEVTIIATELEVTPGKSLKANTK